MQTIRLLRRPLSEIMEDAKVVSQDAEEKAQRPVELSELLTFLLLDAKRYADRAASEADEEIGKLCWMTAFNERGWAIELLLNDIEPAEIGWYSEPGEL